MQNEVFNVVLVEPQIPQNTGNIARLCAVSGCNLFIVGKPGFLMTDKYLKRCGLDYWSKVNIFKFDTIDILMEENRESNFYFFTTKTKRKYTDNKYKLGDFLVFGSETKGLNVNLLKKYESKNVTIPMRENLRSLNLSNSVAIAVYEGIRQNGLY